MHRHLLRLAVYTGAVAAAVTVSAQGGLAPLQNTAQWLTREVGQAAVFFVPSITTEQIQNDYRGATAPDPVTGSSVPARGKVRVLIVPGHRPDSGGAVYGGVYERDVVVDIASALAALLMQNSHYEVTIARTKDAWNPQLQAYFDTHAADIQAYADSQKMQMQELLREGYFKTDVNQVYHNTASPVAALELYGINKWASENAYDLTLHLHLNDTASRRSRVAGEYSGFTIYVPDHQYSNAAASRTFALSLAGRLATYHATSTLPQESAGVVEDRELIAVGSNNSVDAASLLIEYGYIYEPQFQDVSVLPTAVNDYAYATYLGLQDFFHDPVPPASGALKLSFDWDRVTGGVGEHGPGVYTLQAALHALGSYPPVGKSLSDCPVSGVAGPCTRAAIRDYQRSHGLEVTGALGPQTRAALARDLDHSK